MVIIIQSNGANYLFYCLLKKIVLEILHDNAQYTHYIYSVKAPSKIYARERKNCFPWVRSLLPPL